MQGLPPVRSTCCAAVCAACAHLRAPHVLACRHSDRHLCRQLCTNDYICRVTLGVFCLGKTAFVWRGSCSVQCSCTYTPCQRRPKARSTGVFQSASPWGTASACYIACRGRVADLLHSSGSCSARKPMRQNMHVNP